MVSLSTMDILIFLFPFQYTSENYYAFFLTPFENKNTFLI